SHKLLSNDGLGAFHYKSYEAFCVFKKLYNIQSGVTHYRYYRASKRQGLIPAFFYFFTLQNNSSSFVEHIKHELIIVFGVIVIPLCWFKISNIK
ncbi:hypothetical protein, partial [Streptococcus devriesei]